MEFQVNRVLLQSCPAAAHNFWGQSLQFCQHGAGAEQEHAAVPGEPAGGQELLRCGLIGLLHEPLDRYLGWFPREKGSLASM